MKTALPLIIRFVCTKHDCDLECTQVDGNGNPEGGLFRIDYETDIGGIPGNKPKYDVRLAKQLGIIDEDGKVLRPGIWYVFDTSNFYCPGCPKQPEEQTTEEEDRWYEEVYCGKFWSATVVLLVRRRRR